ncbi:PREDICTED: phosphatase and actin regulator 2 [Thamnophis sirtalis]|uniref:Phosphatase and actin regulator n=1 Tax=Thamnophis sirtalis TaxID=35019 RepID=A0A6I9Z158_9SAUR|nr:PREDICTED: phosphatase and actin regulator 2 [Thamnophis sirtalis]
MGQTSVSTLSAEASVDGIDKVSVANSDGMNPGSQTPPFKRKGKFSAIGKIFKPWKWRKKKTSEKFIETSAVLERKISTRQSREELIRRGVLKEINEQDVDATVNYEISNGHTIVITQEAIQRNVRTVEDSGSLSAKAAVSEEKKEDKKDKPLPKGLETSAVSVSPLLPPLPAPPPKPKPKAKKTAIPPKNAAAATTSHKTNEVSHAKKKGTSPSKQTSAPPAKPTSRSGTREAAISSNLKKGHVSKSSSHSSTSSHSKPSKEPTTSKSSTGTPRDKKKHGKQVTTRTPSDGDITSASNTTVENSKTKVELFKSEESLHIIPEAGDTTQNSTVIVPPHPPAVPAPLPPSVPTLSPGCEPAGFSGTEHVPVSIEAGPSVPGTHLNDLHIKTEADTESASSNAVLDHSPEIGGEDTECNSAIKEDQEKEIPEQTSPLLTDELSETSEENPEIGNSKNNHTSDSDSDGPILYTDDDEDDDEDASSESSLATKIHRRDTLAIKLGNRPSKKELEDKNILPRTSEEERQELRHQIGTKLVRYWLGEKRENNKETSGRGKTVSQLFE